MRENDKKAAYGHIYRASFALPLTKWIKAEFNRLACYCSPAVSWADSTWDSAFSRIVFLTEETSANKWVRPRNRFHGNGAQVTSGPEPRSHGRVARFELESATGPRRKPTCERRTVRLWARPRLESRTYNEPEKETGSRPKGKTEHWEGKGPTLFVYRGFRL